jgi:hypothetical protein
MPSGSVMILSRSPSVAFEESDYDYSNQRGNDAADLESDHEMRHNQQRYSIQNPVQKQTKHIHFLSALEANSWFPLFVSTTQA